MRRALVCLLAIFGCGHSGYAVSADAQSGGVPFFPMESADVKKSVYEQTWIELRVDGRFRKAPSNSPVTALPAANPAPGALDVNTASEQDLAKIPELAPFAAKIVANRPYGKLSDLTERKVLTPEVFQKVEKRLAAAPQQQEKGNDTFTRTVVAYTNDLKGTPGDRKAVVDIYTKFMNERQDLEKAWNVSAGVILAGIDKSTLSMSEPDVLTGTEIDQRTPIAVERTRVQVPAAKPLYFQVYAPTGGTAIAELDLAANGTMTKGSSQVQDQLPGVVTSTIGSVLSAALGSTSLNTVASHFLAPAKPPQGIGEPTLLSVDLKLTWVRRLYMVTIVHSSDILESQCGKSISALLTTSATPPNNPGDGALCRATLSVETKRGDDKAKDDGGASADSIGITGTIKLPKAAGSDAATSTGEGKK